MVRKTNTVCEKELIVSLNLSKQPPQFFPSSLLHPLHRWANPQGALRKESLHTLISIVHPHLNG